MGIFPVGPMSHGCALARVPGAGCADFTLQKGCVSKLEKIAAQGLSSGDVHEFLRVFVLCAGFYQVVRIVWANV